MNLSRTCRWMPLALPILLPIVLGRPSSTPPEAVQVCVVSSSQPRGTDLSRELMLACERNDFESARSALRRGADPNERHEDGMPFFFDFVNGSDPSQNRALQFLLEHGADANARDGSSPSGATPLIWAASMGGGARSIEILLAHGARIDERDSIGQTALLRASSVCGGCGCISNSEEALALIKHGANVNAEDREGNTPLLLVLESGSDDINLISTLINHHASLRHRNHAGQDTMELTLQAFGRFGRIMRKQDAEMKRGLTRPSYKYLKRDDGSIQLCQGSEPR